MNVGAIIDTAASCDPDRVALIVDGCAISYGDLAAYVEHPASGLAAGGVVTNGTVLRSMRDTRDASVVS